MGMLTHIDIIVVAQIGTVVFGTVLAAPLLSSLEATRRRAGFICMMVGSFSALVATAMTGLWILVAANAFWTASSLRGFWLLHQSMRREAAHADDLFHRTPKEVPTPLQLVLKQQNKSMPDAGALAEAVSQTLMPNPQDTAH